MTAPKDKRARVEAMLSTGQFVNIFLDPNHPKCLVPPQFRGDACLTLTLGLDMPKPIHDLDITHDGICATLSFANQPFWVFVPWDSLFAACVVGSTTDAVVWHALPEAAGVANPNNVVNLMSRRTPKDQRATRARLAARGGGGTGGSTGGSAA